MDLFIYGTLLIPSVVQAVTGKVFERRSATLQDYARYGLERVPYPGLVPEPGAHTQGALLINIDPETWQRLDAFEGAEYEKVEVTVEQGPAVTYVLRDEHRHRITHDDWDLEAFVARDLPRFLGTG